MRKGNYFMAMLAALVVLSACTTSSAADIEEVADDHLVVEPDQLLVESDQTSYKPGLMQIYDEKKFKNAMEDGVPILLDFSASWCATCAANAYKIDDALAETKIVAFQADFDYSKDLRKEYGVNLQSTYLFFKDGKELRRKTGLLSGKDLVELLFGE